MHRIYRSTSLALSVALGAGYAFAQQDQPRDQKRNQAEINVDVETGKREDAKRMKEIRKVSAITGYSMTNRQEESLGSIEELVMTRDGKVKYAIIGHGGVLGIGQDYIAVPWQKLNVDYANETVRLDTSKAELERAPTFERDNYQELQNPQWTARVHEHFGVDKEKAEDRGKDEATQTAKMGELIRTSQVIGANVHNPQNEGIASVNDLILDADNKVCFAILGKGGFLTLGEEHIAVPLQAISMDRVEDEMVLSLAMTEERLKQAPKLKQDDFQDLRNQQFVENTNRFFGVTEREEVEAEAPAKPREEQPREEQPESEPRDQ